MPLAKQMLRDMTTAQVRRSVRAIRAAIVECVTSTEPDNVRIERCVRKVIQRAWEGEPNE